MIIIGIGYPERAPDYDDWECNCDLYVWSDILNKPIEIFLMGVRVNSESLQKQLKISNADYKSQYHSDVISDKLATTYSYTRTIY